MQRQEEIFRQQVKPGSCLSLLVSTRPIYASELFLNPDLVPLLCYFCSSSLYYLQHNLRPLSFRGLLQIFIAIDRYHIFWPVSITQTTRACFNLLCTYLPSLSFLVLPYIPSWHSYSANCYYFIINHYYPSFLYFFGLSALPMDSAEFPYIPLWIFLLLLSYGVSHTGLCFWVSICVLTWELSSCNLFCKSFNFLLGLMVVSSWGFPAALHTSQKELTSSSIVNYRCHRRV